MKITIYEIFKNHKMSLMDLTLKKKVDFKTLP